MAVRNGPVGRFALHYVAMVIAMVAGMMLLYPLWTLATGGVDDSNVLRGAEVESLVMATTMSIGMGAWMRFRKHTWQPIIEMCAAMYAGFVVLFPGFWAGALSDGDVMMYGHVLMLVFMLVAMLLRRAEYTTHHHGRAHQPR
ncbi:MAG: hypothetical protein ACRDTU_04920 [Micromonosporaceae bacterium]